MTDESQDMFIGKSVNEWIEEAGKKPMPEMLFGEFFLEGELSILFADTGKGKSILAVQIAESIARGEPIEPFKMTAGPRTVVYFDFELSSKQFEMRYSADPMEGEPYVPDHYRFAENFHRMEIDMGRLPEDLKTFRELLHTSIESKVRSTGATVVIIDNLTYLRGANDMAREAIPLMRELRRLKTELGLSILVLAHTPKRVSARTLTVNDLQGSKVLSNFADNVFAIGQSKIDAAFRYVKHIKARSTELLYDDTNVLVGEIRKWEKNFLTFRFYKFSPESEHLSNDTTPMIRARADIVREMSDRGMTQREIAKEIGVSLGTINRYLKMTEMYDDDDYDLNENFDEDEPEEGQPDRPPEPPDDDDEDEDFENYVEDEDEEDPEEEEPKPVKYKTMDDKIEVGDIVMDRNGQLRRRANWGWDCSVDRLP